MDIFGEGRGTFSSSSLSFRTGEPVLGVYNVSLKRSNAFIGVFRPLEPLFSRSNAFETLLGV